MDGWIDEWMDRRKTEGWMCWQMGGCIDDRWLVDGWMDGWMGGWLIDGWMDRRKTEGWMCKQMGGCIDDGWMVG